MRRASLVLSIVFAAAAPVAAVVVGGALAGCTGAPSGEGEGEGEGAAGEGEGVAGEGEGSAGEGEGSAGEGEGSAGGEGEGSGGEGEGEGGSISVVPGTPFTTTPTFTQDQVDNFDGPCFNFTTSAEDVITVTTSGGCADGSGPGIELELFNDDGSVDEIGNTTAGECEEIQVLGPPGNYTLCLFPFEPGTGTTVTIDLEAPTTLQDGDACTPGDIAAVCPTGDDCLVSTGGATLCAAQQTLQKDDACDPAVTTSICDAGAGLVCLDTANGGGTFQCENPDDVRCTNVVEFGGGSVFQGPAGTSSASDNDCNFSGGNDLVLHYVVQSAGDAEITFEGLFVNSIAVRTTCADATTEQGCASRSGDSVRVSAASGADLFVFVDAQAGASNVIVAASEAPVTNGGETCDVAVDLGAATGSVVGSTAGMANDYNLGANPDPCTNFPTLGPDAVYSVLVPAGQTLTATVDASLDPQFWDPAIYLTTTCPFTAIDQCLVGSDNSGADTVRFLNAGGDATVFVIVDNFDGNSGLYQLTWSVE